MYYVDSCYILYITYGPILYAIVGDLQWHASPVVHGYGLRPEKSLYYVISCYILYNTTAYTAQGSGWLLHFHVLSLTPEDSYSGGVHLSDSHHLQVK